MLLHVQLAERLADIAVDDLRGALPAGFRLGLAAECRPVEGEVLALGLGMEVRRRILHEMRAEIGLPVVERPRPEHPGERREEMGLADDHVGQLGRADGGEVGIPRHARRERGELGEGEPVVVGVGVAAFDPCLAGLGELGLEREHGGGLMLRGGIGVADLLQQPDEESAVGVALWGEAFREIVIAVGQAEAALREVEGVAAAVLRVGRDARAEGDARAAEMPFGDHAEQLPGVADGGDALEILGERTEAQLLQPVRVHHGGEEIPDLPARPARGG